jgi:hypothetical protein
LRFVASEPGVVSDLACDVAVLAWSAADDGAFDAATNEANSAELGTVCS